jgi:hypothetical protein
MSGFEVLGLIGNIISITETIIEVYDAFKDLHGLPDAFQEVNKRLPLVEQTLQDVKTQWKNIKSAEEAKAIQTLLTGCQDKSKELERIFNGIAKSSKDNFVVSAYKSVIGKLGKKGRVETLMDDILKDLSVLVAHKVFQEATQKRVETLNKSRQELASVPPSLLDSEFDEKSGGTATQVGGRDQYNVFGGTQKNVDGNYFEARGDQNFGTIPPANGKKAKKTKASSEASDDD